MTKLSIVVLTVVLCTAAMVHLNQGASIVTQPKTVCYYESWIHYRTGDGKMDIEDIDSKLCSHIVYAYFGIDSTSHELKFVDSYLEKDLHDLDKFVQAKGKSKAMIAIGGAINSDLFPIVAANEQYLESFVDSVVKFLVQYQFDGVMIDWYHFGSSNENDFGKLLRKFAQKFANNQFSLGITIAEPNAIENWKILSRNFVEFIKIVDFVNVLTFEYVREYDREAGDSSPLDKQLKTLSALTKQGIPREKLLMGVPFYARVWKLEKGSDFKFTGPGTPGPYTKTPGLLSYNELCTMIKSSPGSFSIQRTDNLSVHEINNQTREWISYEDPQLLAYKASNITTEGYGGMTLYTLANDDYRGLCGERYPLLRAIAQNYIHDHREQENTTLAPKTTTLAPRNDKQGPFVCHVEGKFSDTQICFRHYECVKGEFGAFEMTILFCERHHFWDDKTQMCIETRPASCTF